MTTRPTSELVNLLNYAGLRVEPGDDGLRNLIKEAAAALQSLEARNAELEGALKCLLPFTEDGSPGGCTGKYAGDCEHCAAIVRARAALHPATKTGET